MSETAEKILAEVQKGLLCWYKWKAHGRVLQITNETDAITACLKEAGLDVDSVSVEGFETEDVQMADQYDYIVMIGGLEQSKKPDRMLEKCKGLLKKDGTLLLAVENRLGARYFCGDRDPFTGRSFDGIENYRRASAADGARDGRCYSRAEIEQFLMQAGFESKRFYSVMPDAKHPQLIFAEDYLPKEELGIRYFPLYHYPETVFLEEQYLYTDLIENGMFHAMANAYLVECTLPEQFSNVNQVTISMERREEDAFLTIIRRDKKVEKRAVYASGNARLQQLMKHSADLKQRGISVVDAEWNGEAYVMPYVDTPLASAYLRELIYKDVDAFVAEMDRFRDLILLSSEVVKEDSELGFILKRGYFDLVPLNCFFVDGNFMFFDQEFALEEYPVNVLLTRLVDLVYQGDTSMEQILSREFFLERYGLKAQIKLWRRMINEFLRELRNETELRVFHEKHRKKMGMIHTNRQRMNFSESEYQKVFVDIFDGIENRKLILFGTGNFSKKFMALYGKDYSIYAVLDNNKEKWGTEFEGIKVYSPEILKYFDKEEYKVVICIKNYLAVLKQLQNTGVKHIGIYDSDKEYARKRAPHIVKERESEAVPKKYGVGYVAGVFDLFHIGHLNMFKRAKEQSEYLIVGVVTDEGVRKNKKVEPFIPFEERIEMVRSCKYVDEAVEIPLDYAGTKDAYRMYHFDVQFSGSDYVDNPNWLAEKAFLEKNGAELVFFPYTEQTSSTKIKKLINKRLE